MLNPEEKTTLEIQPSINNKNKTRNRNKYSNMETNST